MYKRIQTVAKYTKNITIKKVYSSNRQDRNSIKYQNSGL